MYPLVSSRNASPSRVPRQPTWSSGSTRWVSYGILATAGWSRPRLVIGLRLTLSVTTASESYLVEALGLPREESHAEAERLDHHVSAGLEARLEAALRTPVSGHNGHPPRARDGEVPTVRGG